MAASQNMQVIVRYRCVVSKQADLLMRLRQDGGCWADAEGPDLHVSVRYRCVVSKQADLLVRLRQDCGC